MHGFLVGHDLADERLAVNTYDLVTSEHTGTFGWTVAYDVLHMYGVLTYGELNAYACE